MAQLTLALSFRLNTCVVIRLINLNKIPIKANQCDYQFVSIVLLLETELVYSIVIITITALVSITHSNKLLRRKAIGPITNLTQKNAVEKKPTKCGGHLFVMTF